MADSNSQVTTVKLEVDGTEKTGTFPGNLTTFVGANVEKLWDVVSDNGVPPLVELFQLSAFTVGAAAGVTVDYHYRRIFVPTQNVNLVQATFFTAVELGITSAMFVKVQKEDDTGVYYDVFIITEGVGTTTNLDLYVDTNRVPPEDQIITFPTFPNATDPVRGANRTRSNAGNDRIVDSFFLAQP